MLCYVINSVSFLRKIIMYLWKLCPSRNTSNVADLPACCIETINWRCNQIALRVWWLVLKLPRESNTAKLSTRNFVDLHRLSMTSSVPLSKIFKTLIFVLVMGWKLPQLIAAAFSCSSILFNFYLPLKSARACSSTLGSTFTLHYVAYRCIHDIEWTYK